MISNLLIVRDPHDARAEQAARAWMIKTHGQFRMVRPMVLKEASPRDAASVFFKPMAAAIESKEPLIMLGGWDQLEHLDRPRQRILERTALTLGVALIDWSKSDHVAVQQSGFLGSPRLSRGVGAVAGYCPPPAPASDGGGVGGFTGAPAPVAGAMVGGGGRPLLPGVAGPGAGAYRAGQILLIGSRPNSAKSGSVKHRLPFVSLDDYGCSLWLAGHLEEHGIQEDEIYWINSEDSEGNPTSEIFLERLQPKIIVAFDDATRWVPDDTPYYYLASPAWYVREKKYLERRKKPVRPYRLGPLLKEKFHGEV